MPLEQALAIIVKDAGSHFDPKLVDQFVGIAPTLHGQIGQASESELQASLLKQATNYFLQTSIQAKAPAGA